MNLWTTGRKKTGLLQNAMQKKKVPTHLGQPRSLFAYIDPDRMPPIVVVVRCMTNFKNLGVLSGLPNQSPTKTRLPLMEACFSEPPTKVPKKQCHS